MSWILHLETSTKVCSVALSFEGEVKCLEEIADDQYAHGEQLTLLIEKVVRNAGITLKDLAAVSVASGPGSYTGLRIGVSTAKGLCFALDIPILLIDSLTALAQLPDQSFAAYNRCPMIDARRMEVYATIFSPDGTVLKPMSADVLDATTYMEFEPLVVFGDGAEKMRSLWQNRNCLFVDILSSAAGQATVAYARFVAAQFDDRAYCEPIYLKNFGGKAL